MKQQIFIIFFSLVLCTQQAFGMWNWLGGESQTTLKAITLQLPKKNEQKLDKKQRDRDIQYFGATYSNGPTNASFPIKWHPQDENTLAFVDVENSFDPKTNGAIKLWKRKDDLDEVVVIPDVAPLNYQIISFNADGSLMAYKKNTQKQYDGGLADNIGLFNTIEKKGEYFPFKEASLIALNKQVPLISVESHPNASTIIYSIDAKTLQTKEAYKLNGLDECTWNPTQNIFAANGKPAALIDAIQGKVIAKLNPPSIIMALRWLTGSLLAASSFAVEKICYLYDDKGICSAKIDCKDLTTASALYVGSYNEKAGVFPLWGNKKMALYDIKQKKFQTIIDLEDSKNRLVDVSIHPDGKICTLMYHLSKLMIHDMTGKLVNTKETLGVNVGVTQLYQEDSENHWNKAGSRYAVMVRGMHKWSCQGPGDAVMMYDKNDLLSTN